MVTGGVAHPADRDINTRVRNCEILINSFFRRHDLEQFLLFTEQNIVSPLTTNYITP